MSLPPPSDEQWRAIKKAKAWFEDNSFLHQEFKIFGPAGAGKSTLLKHLLNELNLIPDVDVIILTLLGKASDVLRRKGLPSVTIHSFLYKPSIVPASTIEALRREIDATPAGDEKRALQEKLRRMISPSFKTRDLGDLSDIKLLVIDEISMVPDQVLSDLLTLGIPILELGDPFQLKPVGSNCTAILGTPDVMLTEVHRQALENPILRFATRIRTHNIIEKMETEECFVTNEPVQLLPDFLAKNFDQVICGFHRTRHQLNRDIRLAHGRATVMPTPEDKLICVKNKKISDIQRFFNGQQVVLSNIAQIDHLVDKDFSATVGPTFEDWTTNEMIYVGHFLDNYAHDRFRAEKDYQFKLDNNPLEVDYADAITGHKAQGSEWRRVCVIDDNWGQTPDDQARWCYTEATRAMDQLVFCTQKVA